MKLTSVVVDHFKNILNSGNVKIQPHVTCVVGKNESGKTAFLQSLHRFNPAQSGVSFNSQRQYPAWLEKLHRRQRNLDDATPITSIFELETSDITVLDAKFGKGALKSKTIVVKRTYGNRLEFAIDADEGNIAKHIVRGQKLPGGLTPPQSIASLDALIADLRVAADGDSPEATAVRTEIANSLTASKNDCLGDGSIDDALIGTLENLLPVFFYFDEYSQLPGSVKIRELLQKDSKAMTAAEQSARALLSLAGADGDYLLNPDYETRKRELENVANSITHEVLT